MSASEPPVSARSAVGVAGASWARPLAHVLALYPLALCAASIGLRLAPQTVGPLAVATIFLPHLSLVALLLLPVAIVLPVPTLRGSLLALALVGLVNAGPPWGSGASAPPTGPTWRVLTWNLGHRDGAPRSEIVELLLSSGADLVALQELKPVVAEALEADPAVRAAWPGRVLAPARDASGMGLLARWPLTEDEHLDAPVRLHARVEVPELGAVEVVNAHPYPGQITWVGGRISYAYDGTRRDADLARIRAFTAPLEASGAPVILLGDFNVVPEEVGNTLLVAGLRDAHADAGRGPGWTWRPMPAVPLGIGLLRIDRVLTTPHLRAVTTAVHCGRVGDHCALTATLTRAAAP